MRENMWKWMSVVAGAGIVLGVVGCRSARVAEAPSRAAQAQGWAATPYQSAADVRQYDSPARNLSRQTGWMTPLGETITIINQPQSQIVTQGFNVSFSVLAVETPPSTNGLSYQWQVNTNQLNGDSYWANVTSVASTNPVLNLTAVSVADAGFYRVIVSGSPGVTSAAAALWVAVPAVGLTVGTTVFGTPVVGGGQAGGTGGCTPFNYSGYILYVDPNSQYGGWAPDFPRPTSPAQDSAASDPQNANTVLEACGWKGDVYCHNPGPLTMPPDYPSGAPKSYQSPAYQFIIYFPSQLYPQVPSGPYGVTLVNLK